jgi:hypothetical protein
VSRSRGGGPHRGADPLPEQAARILQLTSPNSVASTAAARKPRDTRKDGDETILGNPRNRPETNGG